MPRIIRATRVPSSSWSTLLVGAAVGGLAAWLVLRARRAPARRALDLDGVTERMRARPGADGLHLRSLGNGIVEVVGSATADLDVPGLLAALAAEPGVSVVVNRVWSAEPAAQP